MRLPPAILFIDVIAAWRVDPTDYDVYKSRPSDFTRLFRLGYYHKPGDFREQDRPYNSIAEAEHAQVRLNEQRHLRGAAPLDTICTYARVFYQRVPWKVTP